MMLLTRIRLVNWHCFNDTTIDFKQMTLLAGDNGTGKSTIIDAIQYALVANIRKIRFNAAAADRRSGRTLESYCRCKIGSESQEYVRGDTISHVILQFSQGDRSFCAGIMIESYQEGNDTGEHPWIFENAQIENIEMYDKDRYFNPAEFKQALKSSGGVICSTKRDYNSRLTHLLGVHRRNTEFNPYLETIVRSVNFTPFSSVDKFVCNYILEERQVDISIMRENLHNYREAERQAETIETRIKDLEKIDSRHNDLDYIKEQLILQDLLLRRIDFEICGEYIHSRRMKAEKIEHDLEIYEQKNKSLREQISRKEDLLNEMKLSLAADDTHRLWESLNKDLKNINYNIEQDEIQLNKYKLQKQKLGSLLNRNIEDDVEKEQY